MAKPVSTVMFRDTLCLLLAFCHFVVGESLKPIMDNNSMLLRNSSAQLMFQDIIIPVLHKKSTKKRTVMDGIIRNGRSKRGIILIDEDFDKPAEPGVKHGWSSGEVEARESLRLNDKNIFTDEGSGSNVISETTETMYSAGQTGDHGNRISDTTETTYLADQTRTGSKLISEPTEATYSISQTNVRNTKPPSTETSASNISKAWITNIEGSGDDISVQSTVTAFTESIPDLHIIQNLCVNFTCFDSEIYIYPEHVAKVPEGSNLLLSCSATNSSMLYWYKDNGTEASLLRKSQEHYELFYNISHTKTHHSGKYICLRIKENSCCLKEVHITVYVVPAYQYHLLLICIIMAVCLITCTVLGIWRTITIKKYAKQFIVDKQNSQMPPLL
ncbi:hypothetical protein X975_15426, partial [Stegodyphus mimosarum]